jgi:hypothetical protein
MWAGPATAGRSVEIIFACPVVVIPLTVAAGYLDLVLLARGERRSGGNKG